MPGRSVALLGGAVHYPHEGSEGLSVLGPDSVADHLVRFGERPSCAGDGARHLMDALSHADLVGRGGGHFGVATKWRRVLTAQLARSDGSPVVVANGAESEPLSRKDTALLEHRPHLVLDGLACAAETLGAADAVLWLHEDAHEARAAVTRALAERATHLPDSPVIRVELAPHRYLAGESSAVVRGLTDGQVRPTFDRVPTAERGVQGRPTLVQNVETLARVALIARGYHAETVLLTLVAVNDLVVVERPENSLLAAAIADGLGPARFHAVLLGGYGGQWLPRSEADDLSLSEGELNVRGRSLGAGIALCLPKGACGLTRTAEIAGYLADQGARQCGPCRSGLPALADGMRLLADCRTRRRDAHRLEVFLAEVDGRGACHHPDGAVQLIRSALSTFADDVAAHRRGRCLHAGGRGA